MCGRSSVSHCLTPSERETSIIIVYSREFCPEFYISCISCSFMCTFRGSPEYVQLTQIHVHLPNEKHIDYMLIYIYTHTHNCTRTQYSARRLHACCCTSGVKSECARTTYASYCIRSLFMVALYFGGDIVVPRPPRRVQTALETSLGKLSENCRRDQVININEKSLYSGKKQNWGPKGVSRQWLTRLEYMSKSPYEVRDDLDDRRCCRHYFLDL